MLSMCLGWLGWKKKLGATLTYQTEPTDTVDFRNILLSKEKYNTRNFFQPKPYTQVFGKTFVENMSIVDLIFCKGPEAVNFLHAPA